jgi:large subunit ribosomal protein L4
MQATLYNQKGQAAGNIELSDSVFALPMNRDLLFQVVNALMANRRQVIAHAKGRSEVRGGGKKPWKQKGTGRARHGSIRSPIWKGGGVTHGPTKERNFKQKINQKAAKKALGIALSTKFRDEKLVVLDALTLETSKTKEAAAVMKQVTSAFANYSKTKNGDGSLLVVLPDTSPKLMQSMRNIPHIDIAEARNINALSVLSHKYLLVLKDSVDAIQKRFKKK